MLERCLARSRPRGPDALSEKGILPNIGQFFIDALFLQLSCSCISQIGDELHKAAHVGVIRARAPEESGGGGRHDGRSVGGDGPKVGQKLSRDRKQHDRDNQCDVMSTRSEIDEG